MHFGITLLVIAFISSVESSERMNLGDTSRSYDGMREAKAAVINRQASIGIMERQSLHKNLHHENNSNKEFKSNSALVGLTNNEEQELDHNMNYKENSNEVVDATEDNLPTNTNFVEVDSELERRLHRSGRVNTVLNNRKIGSSLSSSLSRFMSVDNNDENNTTDEDQSVEENEFGFGVPEDPEISEDDLNEAYMEEEVTATEKEPAENTEDDTATLMKASLKELRSAQVLGERRDTDRNDYEDGDGKSNKAEAEDKVKEAPSVAGENKEDETMEVEVDDEADEEKKERKKLTKREITLAQKEIATVFSGVLSSLLTNMLTQNPNIVRRKAAVQNAERTEL